MMSNFKTRMTKTSYDDKYKLMNAWEAKNIPIETSFEERKRILASLSILSDTPKYPESICQTVTPMPLMEEIIVALLWLLFFSLMMLLPFLILGLLYFRPPLAGALIALCVGVSSIPVKFAPSVCYHYLATLNLKYFSYRAIWKVTQPEGCYIGVQPPHGLFPFGGILGLFAMPRFAGFVGRGVAASAILNFPIIGNFLRLIGCIDASRRNVDKYLNAGESIGISTGGIAEIFETASDGKTECIILKSRGGVCKLALQHGVPIVPAYLFGNCQALDVWYDSYGIMKWLSRKLQVSIVFFTGRFFLPIPYRTPLLCVFGDKIPVTKVEHPSPEQIQALLDTLQEKIRELFDEHKASFGWSHVQLVIK